MGMKIWYFTVGAIHLGVGLSLISVDRCEHMWSPISLQLAYKTTVTFARTTARYVCNVMKRVPSIQLFVDQLGPA